MQQSERGISKGPHRSSGQRRTQGTKLPDSKAATAPDIDTAIHITTKV